MCGLAGFLRLDGAETRRDVLCAMTRALSHRGPDGEGLHVEPGLALGHRRLSIIDLAGGAQPMGNEDGSVVIVFNGEIYNHAELRAGLERAGHVFATHCDTETVVHAWEEYGPACLDRLMGMFAFALWDRGRGELFLARDRAGEKPLYWAEHQGAVVFGSEMAAMRAYPGMPSAIDPCAVDDFFALGYVPDPATIFAGIERLEAGHYLLVRPGRAVGRPVRYWRADAHPAETEAAELPLRLCRAVQAQMVSDVPLGAFLSGGVDSAAVVAMAARLRGTPLDTFTIGFPGAEDERPAAALMARHAGCRHWSEPGEIDMIDAARWQARLFGEPFGDSSAIPTAMVSALARQHVTVALSGDGGDEVFGGYRRYRWHAMTEGVRRFVPAGQRRRVFGALSRAYPKMDRAPRWLRAKHTLTELSLDSALGYYATLCKTQDARRRALFTPELEARLDGHDPAARIRHKMAEFAGEDPLRQAQLVDVETYLPGDILVKVDRTSMAAGLEVRAPFLDASVMGWGLALRPGEKLRGGVGKHALRAAMQDRLPREILARRKQGFATSPARQFRAGAQRLRARLLGEAMLSAGLFQAGSLAQLIDEHEAGVFDHSQVLWLLLVFEGFLWEQAQPGRVAAGPFALAGVAA